MPRLYPDAPDLAVSPDGVWVAELTASSLRLYDLGRDPGRGQRLAADAAGTRLAPIAEVTRAGRPGRIVFLGEDRLLHLWLVPPADGAADEAADETAAEGHVYAELLAVPTLSEIGRGLRVPGCTRILGVGPAGAVVAPSGPGAEIVAARGSELTLHRTFIRGEVISAVAAPDRRFLMEQRSGFELWDPQARKALGRLVLNTRQSPAYLGFALGGRVLWAATGTIPVHVEVFRASDGRRLFELDQPGRALQADAGPGRLLVAVEERATVGLLDLDLGARALRRVALPAGSPPPRSLVVNPEAGASEVLIRLETEQAPLLRLPLPRPLARVAPVAPLPPLEDRPGAGRAAGGRTLARGTHPDASTRALRQARPETRLIRRPAPAPVEADDDELAPVTPRPVVSSAVSSADSDELAPEADLLGDPEADALGDSVPVLALGLEGTGERAGAEKRPPSRQSELLGRVFDPRKSPAAWQWELARWAQSLLLGSGAALAPMPPEGGPLAALAKRLRLSPVASKALGLLYAAQSLLGCRPHGMRPVELAQCLGPLHEEPAVLAELLPLGPLRTLELLALRTDGRLKLRQEVILHLLGAPCPELQPSPAGGLGREPLMPGLHLLPGVFPHRSQLPSGQPLLRVDGLREPRLLPALTRALRRAQLYDAAVLLDGVAGLSFPAFTSDGTLPHLRALLLSPRVPLVLCAMPEAPAALGLMARSLPTPASPAEQPAPLLPSAPLPLGTSWRAPTLPALAALADGPLPRGRLEPLVAGDHRAAIVVSASATPDAYATAAYLAARDGALLVLDAELTTVRALVLGMLLRQLPVCIAALPPAGPGTPWPAQLQPFAVPARPRL